MVGIEEHQVKTLITSRINYDETHGGVTFSAYLGPNIKIIFWTHVIDCPLEVRQEIRIFFLGNLKCQDTALGLYAQACVRCPVQQTCQATVLNKKNLGKRRYEATEYLLK